MWVDLLAIALLATGMLFLSSARLGLMHSTEYERYRMKSAAHMKRWGALLLVGGIMACSLAGLLFAV